MVKKILQYPVLIFFVLFFGVITIMDFLAPHRTSSELENRDLAQKPPFTFESLIQNKYSQVYEKYINDQFVGRDGWITVKSLAETSLAKTENNGVVYGKDDYMFDKLNAPDQKQLEKNTKFYQEFLEKYPNQSITVGMIPNSYMVLHEKVPFGLNNMNQNEYVEKLFSQLDGENVNKIYFMDALAAHKDEYIYYRTDHHWTTLGAYYAYCAYVKSLGISPVSLDKMEPYVNQEEGFLGTYFSKAKLFQAEKDTITWYNIPVDEVTINLEKVNGMYNESKFETRDMYGAFLQGNNGQTVIKSQVNQNKVQGENSKILVIKDSYANCFVPFLLYHFDEVHVVDLRHFAPKLSQYLQENQFDEILLMYNFKNFAEDINLPKLRY